MEVEHNGVNEIFKCIVMKNEVRAQHMARRPGEAVIPGPERRGRAYFMNLMREKAASVK